MLALKQGQYFYEIFSFSMSHLLQLSFGFWEMWLNSAGITEGFSMCGGDFVEVYNDPSQVGKLVHCLFWYIYIYISDRELMHDKMVFSW